jgi:integrase
MPRVLHMTWEKARRRWRKMYKGKVYTVSPRELGCNPTMVDGIGAANEWWEKKKAELDGRERKPRPGTPAAQLAILEAYAGRKLDSPEEQLAAALAMREEYGANPPEGLAEAVLGPERVARIRAGIGNLLDAPAAPPERTVGRLVETWLQQEASRVRAGKVGLSRANMNKVCLKHFEDWIGAATPVEAVTEPKWLGWHAFLSGRVEAGAWNVAHCDRIYGVAKRFVKFLWEMRLIDLPRNLDNRNLAFTVAPRKITVWAAEEIHKLLAVMTGQSVLHVLLMLNCGMLGKDINDLRHDEVDWAAGVITRKRSKTRGEQDVPEVRYKLWDRTFALLERHRSADPDVVLLTTGGKRWIEEGNAGGTYHRSDKVASNLKYWMGRAGVKRPPKALRATAASKLGEHPQYKYYTTYFLGHSPRTVQEKHYVRPSDAEFVEALAWLKKALGL